MELKIGDQVNYGGDAGLCTIVAIHLGYFKTPDGRPKSTGYEIKRNDGKDFSDTHVHNICSSDYFELVKPKTKSTLTRGKIIKAIEDAVLIGNDLGNTKFTIAEALVRKDKLIKELLG